MQFDNTANFDTSLIITNAEIFSFSRPMVVTLAFYDGSGNRIMLDQITIPIAGNTFFSMYQRYPQLREQRRICGYNIDKRGFGRGWVTH
jgi:hypothetical protein